MKYRDIERMASDAVRDYMDDGWVLDFDSFPRPGVHCLNSDGERIAVGIRTAYYDEKHARGWSQSVNVVLMFISRSSKCSSDWLDPENVIYEKVLFKVNGDWYVEDKSVAVEARAKAIERERERVRGEMAPERTFHPTKAFLDKWVRGMRGWKNVKSRDVVITKQKCAQGIYYRVRKTVGKGDWFTVTSFGKR